MEQEMRLRGIVARGTVLSVDDSGPVQRVDVEIHAGVIRQGVEVLLPAGLASAPVAGAGVVLFAVGGDQGDLVALPTAAPGTRLGNLAAGEIGISDGNGNRVVMRAGGIVEIRAAAKVRVVAPQVEIVASSGVTITGDLTVSGDVSDLNGSMQEMRTVYNGHRHGSGPTTPDQMT